MTENLRSKLSKMTTEEVMNLASQALEKQTTNELFKMPEPDAPHPYTIGAAMLIRTVTMTLTGRIVWVGPQELFLEDAAWIADTGRFHELVQLGHVEKLLEVEPCRGPAIVGRGSIVDAYPWLGELPRVAK